MSDRSAFQSWFDAHPELDAEALSTLDAFVGLLKEESEKQNLIAKSTVSVIWDRHILDSAQLLDHVPRGTRRILDIGSGAGLPGLVMAILQPDLHVTLIEQRRKRCEFLNDAVSDLSLENVTVIMGDVAKLEADPFPVITARAFAHIQKVVRSAAQFRTNETVYILPKGASAEGELALLPKTATFHVEQSITEPSAGILIGTICDTVTV